MTVSLLLRTAPGFAVEVLETLSFEALEVYGEYDSPNFRVLETNGGVDPIDTGCLPVGRCIGAMTRVSFTRDVLRYTEHLKKIPFRGGGLYFRSSSHDEELNVMYLGGEKGWRRRSVFVFRRNQANVSMRYLLVEC